MLYTASRLFCKQGGSIKRWCLASFGPTEGRGVYAEGEINKGEEEEEEGHSNSQVPLPHIWPR